MSMPLGFHVLPNLGHIPTESVLGGFKNPAAHVIRVMGLFADTFNPIGNAGLSMQTLAPTVLDPIAAMHIDIKPGQFLQVGDATITLERKDGRRVRLVNLVSTSAYTPQTAVHQYLADIPVSARIAGPVTLTAKATTGGAADAADCTFTSVLGATINAIVLYKDTGTEATSPLIAYIDTATGLVHR